MRKYGTMARRFGIHRDDLHPGPARVKEEPVKQNNAPDSGARRSTTNKSGGSFWRAGQAASLLVSTSAR
jgi:hypothetical protein